MKMNEFMTALQNHLTTQEPNYPDNAESIFEVLFDAYNEYYLDTANNEFRLPIVVF